MAQEKCYRKEMMLDSCKKEITDLVEHLKALQQQNFNLEQTIRFLEYGVAKKARE